MKLLRQAILIIALPIVLTACVAGSGQLYADYRGKLETLPSEEVRVVLYRDDLYYAGGVPATITIDGKGRGSLKAGNFIHLELPPKPTKIVVETTAFYKIASIMPGQSTVEFSPKKGGVYYIKLVPAVTDSQGYSITRLRNIHEVTFSYADDGPFIAGVVPEKKAKSELIRGEMRYTEDLGS